jgi:hypothetical protein
VKRRKRIAVGEKIPLELTERERDSATRCSRQSPLHPRRPIVALLLGPAMNRATFREAERRKRWRWRLNRRRRGICPRGGSSATAPNWRYHFHLLGSDPISGVQVLFRLGKTSLQARRPRRPLASEAGWCWVRCSSPAGVRSRCRRNGRCRRIGSRRSDGRPS